MKLPRFSLRTLFVLITLISIPLGWVAYQLNWIRQRRAFVEEFQSYNGLPFIRVDPRYPPPECPWSISLFGESPRDDIRVPKQYADEARRLFPEALVTC